MRQEKRAVRSGLRHRATPGLGFGVAFAILGRLSSLLALHPSFLPVVLWDDRCRWREAILPGYKSKRWADPDQQEILNLYQRQTDVAKVLLAHAGVPQLKASNYEADDLAGLICRNAPESWSIRLATTDRDWLQALKQNVDWFPVGGGPSITIADLDKIAIIPEGPFLSCEHFVQSRALSGDASDEIPGVKGVGLKTAAKIIRENGSVESMWKRFDAGHKFSGEVLNRVAGPGARELYLRNLRLIDWRLAPTPFTTVTLEPGNLDAAKFDRACREHHLPTISVNHLGRWSGSSKPATSVLSEAILNSRS